MISDGRSCTSLWCLSALLMYLKPVVFVFNENRLKFSEGDSSRLHYIYVYGPGMRFLRSTSSRSLILHPSLIQTPSATAPTVPPHATHLRDLYSPLHLTPNTQATFRVCSTAKVLYLKSCLEVSCRSVIHAINIYKYA